MFHQRLQQYSCDQCERLIPRSEPVLLHDFGDGSRHFCEPEHGGDCRREYEQELVADLAGAYD
jgi:hypothetical protein